MRMRLDFRTVRGPSRYEPERTKGSRFIAAISPAQDVQAAEAFVASLRSEYDDASHHCFAWRLGPDGETFRSSDDGEPGGSAGRPILLQIEGHDLTDTVVVVTRYFGGTKLGVGGLVRAYGGAAGQALDRAEILITEITRTLHIEYPYECTGAVEALFARYRERGARDNVGLVAVDLGRTPGPSPAIPPSHPTGHAE